MFRQDKLSWNKGRVDAMRGAPSKCSRGLSYASGYQGTGAASEALPSRHHVPERQRGAVIYGYARISTDGQSVDAQVRQLKAAGARQVFREVASGAKTDRAQLRRVLARLDAGDVLMVSRVDRLARSTRDLFNTLARSPARAPVSDRSATRGPTLPRRTAA